MFVFVLFLLAAFLYYVLCFRRPRKALYELASKLPDLGDALPVLGHTHWFTGSPEQILKNIQILSGKIQECGGLGKVWIGPELYIVVLNPADVKVVLESCFQKGSTYKFLRSWLGNGLFIAPVELWKAHRRLLLPIFHNKVVEEYIQVFGEQSAVLVERLQAKLSHPEFDIFHYITSCTLDIVFETAMGERMDVQHSPETPYLRARTTVMSIINMRFFKAWLQPDWLFNLTPYAKLQKENIDLTHAFADKVVKKKRYMFANNDEQLNKEHRRDLLELLLDLNSSLSDENIREHIDSITIAGNDTTALVVAYTLMLLGQHPNVQEKVFAELHNIFGDSERLATKEDLNGMEYLELVLKEAMRLYTVVPIIGRHTDKEIQLSTCKVPAGVACIVLPMMMHRCKQTWGPDADLFNPDRFLPQNSLHRHPCAFIPFSFGLRNCIGRHYAMMAMKCMVSSVVRRYRITSRGCDRLKIEILLFPVPGHLVAIERR